MRADKVCDSVSVRRDRDVECRRLRQHRLILPSRRLESSARDRFNVRRASFGIYKGIFVITLGPAVNHSGSCPTAKIKCEKIITICPTKAVAAGALWRKPEPRARLDRLVGGLKPSLSRSQGRRESAFPLSIAILTRDDGRARRRASSAAP